MRGGMAVPRLLIHLPAASRPMDFTRSGHSQMMMTRPYTAPTIFSWALILGTLWRSLSRSRLVSLLTSGFIRKRKISQKTANQITPHREKISENWP